MVSVSTLVAILAAVITVYPVASYVLAEEVAAQIQPLTKAFIVTTTTTVRNLRVQISAMIYKQGQCSGATDCWTILDQEHIDASRADLAAAVEVLASLQGT